MKIYNTLYSELAYQNLSDEEKLFYSGWDSLGEELISRYGNKIIKNKSTYEKKVYLTFDDAPDQYCTYPILKILKQWNVKATFSIVGIHIDENIKVLEKIYEDGHYIINHTMNHLDMTLLSRSEIEYEIHSVDKKLENILGLKTSLVRPPYGKVNSNVCKYIIENGYNIALWSYNTCDWVVTQKDQILTGFMDQVRNGEIILLHSYENKENTIDVLPDIISGLYKRGFSFEMLDTGYSV